MTFGTLVQEWVGREPVASLWLGVVTVILFGVMAGRRVPGVNWGRQLSAALATALVFACLAGGAYFVLDADRVAFGRLYGPFFSEGSLSNRNWRGWQQRYGDVVEQTDLQVTQYVTHVSREPIPPAAASQATLFHNVTVEQPVEQNSQLGFRGLVFITMAAPGASRSEFSAYDLAAIYAYDLINPAESETRVVFTFPLPGRSSLYEHIRVTVDGVELTGWTVAAQALTWEDRWAPGQQVTVVIHYHTRGMNGYLYRVSQPRDLTNFTFSLISDGVFGTITEPSHSLQFEEARLPSAQRPYHVCRWSVARAFMAPAVGMDLHRPWPYAPYQALIDILPWIARASTLFLCLAVLTLLICGQPVQVGQLAALTALFALPFLVLFAGGVPPPAAVGPEELARWQVNLLPWLALAPLGLAWAFLRQVTRLPRFLLLGLMAFFMARYVFIGLVADGAQRNALEGLVQAGLLAYLFGLVLFVRLRRA